MLKKLVSGLLTVSLTLAFIGVADAASVSQLQKQSSAFKNKISSVQSQINSTKQQKASTQSEIQELDRQLASVQAEITQLNTKIQETTANLNKSQQELKEAIATREAHYNTLKKRIRVMYEYGNSGYLEALLSSDNFSDFITRLEYTNKLVEYDNKVLKDYTHSEEVIATNVKTIAKDKKQIEDMKAEQAKKQQILDNNIARKNQIVKQLDSNQSTYEAQIADLQQQDANVQALIQKAEAEAKAREAAARQRLMQQQKLRRLHRQQRLRVAQAQGQNQVQGLSHQDIILAQVIHLVAQALLLYIVVMVSIISTQFQLIMAISQILDMVTGHHLLPVVQSSTQVLT